MRDFGYSKRGREVNEAHAEVHAAFEGVVNRYDRSDPRTQRWLDAIKAYRAACARAYPEPLREVDRGIKRASEIDTVDMLDFLEADPFFDRSGYMKEKLLGELKRRKLDHHEIKRLQAIILSVVKKDDHRREFLRYCRASANVDDEHFRAELGALERSDDPHVSQRANWVLAALDGKWLDLKRAARGHERRGNMYFAVPNPRIP
ncbi:hypothetical protein KRR38_14545 [Novosphingobium sp. G106]|uniref:hypothetical protein n=1 Tax=Novosphingobium sp. G106 TaxID=2849500 RepID=UPI001C2DA77B|nr:hypothetical protein [Novosphingobium sp. G106]MBV1688858.1 hypothetical protein [Novosphingobium sp. G106]